MAGLPAFTQPPRARFHCRHYSYDMGSFPAGVGPVCAVGCSFTDPGASAACMPGAASSGKCDRREEWTDEERAAWDAWRDASVKRLTAAISALPAPIPLNTSGRVTCPSCGGWLHYGRWHRGASLECETKHCAAARFNIAAGADWPAGGAHA